MLFLEEPTQLEEQEYELNPQVHGLIALWRTELLSPEVLPFQKELIASIKSILEDQQV